MTEPSESAIPKIYALGGVTAEVGSEFRPTRPLWAPLAASTCRAGELGSSLSRDLQYAYPRKHKINRSADGAVNSSGMG
jgi:hypothetical protein